MIVQFIECRQVISRLRVNLGILHNQLERTKQRVTLLETENGQIQRCILRYYHLIVGSMEQAQGELQETKMKLDEKINEVTHRFNALTAQINVRDERLRLFLQDLLASKRFGLFIKLYEWSILNVDEAWIPEVWMDQPDEYPPLLLLWICYWLAKKDQGEEHLPELVKEREWTRVELLRHLMHQAMRDFSSRLHMFTEVMANGVPTSMYRYGNEVGWFVDDTFLSADYTEVVVGDDGRAWATLGGQVFEFARGVKVLLLDRYYV